jgi:hypothetical protein
MLGRDYIDLKPPCGDLLDEAPEANAVNAIIVG